jgi:hypothetical protein
MATLIQQLDAMRNLPENWDGYGAAVLVPEALDLAKEIVILFASLRGGDDGLADFYVAPGRDGGVLIEWDDANSEHELEINPDGSLGFLHIEKLTQEMTKRTYRPGKFATPNGLLSELLLVVSRSPLRAARG